MVSLKQDLDRINLENSVYQKYYDRKIGEMGVEEEDKKKAKSKNRRQPPSTLNIDQKYDIAIAVQEELYNDIEKNKKNYEKMKDTLRAVLEETEIRISELKRDAYEFKKRCSCGCGEL